MSFPEGISTHINRICRYLALDDFGHRSLTAVEVEARIGGPRFDVVAVFGNQVVTTIERACFLQTSGLAHRILFSGGIGHSTQLLYENLRKSHRFGDLARSGAIAPTMSEAALMAAVASSACGVVQSAILVEDRSANTGENAKFSWDLLRAQMPRVRSIVILQDPVMQRRALLTLQHTLRAVPDAPELFSHSVFVPQVSVGGFVIPQSSSDPPPWDRERFVSLLLGEVERLRNDEQGYGPNGRGFIPAEDVSAEVLASYARVRSWRVSLS